LDEFDLHKETHDPQVLITSLILQMANYGSALKHFAFNEEQEWRLILLNLPHDQDPPVQHLSNSTFRPYVELDFTSDFLSTSLMQVVVGPQSHQEATLHGIASFLRAQTGRDVPVVRSRVPYNARI
jgi:hypothetical protein